MFERLAKNGRDFEEQTKEHINEYADAGLRTLVFAYRELDEEEYNKFNEEFTEAKNSVSADREEMMEQVAEKIERDLILLGATAVEDKLQNGVSLMHKSKRDLKLHSILKEILLICNVIALT
jgi:phospholipid-translocating ATPase